MREDAQIVPRQRPQHDGVLAERHRMGVAIFGLVVDGQDRHRCNHRDFRLANL